MIIAYLNALSSFVLSASQDYQILILDDTLRQLGINTFENRSITDVDFHPYDPMEVLISFYTKRDGSYRAEITSAAFAPDESVVVSGDAAGVLKFWQLE